VEKDKEFKQYIKMKGIYLMIIYYGGNKHYYEFKSNEQEYKNYKCWSIQYYNEDEQLHRLDGPALEYWYGNKFWYKNGKLHREDGPAIIESSTGYKYYFYNGEQINVSTDKKFKQYFKLKIFT
jgi:hypothetical protein